MEMAFEELCNRFDRYLSRLRVAGARQRGLVILDERAHETSLQAMAQQFRRLGTAWGVVRNLADTPLFINSRASRVVPLADHVAYAVFRRYEHGDSQYFDLIASRFDSADGVGIPSRRADSILPDEARHMVPRPDAAATRDREISRRLNALDAGNVPTVPWAPVDRGFQARRRGSRRR